MKRQCTQCGLLKDLTMFGRQKNGPQGRRSACKQCRKEARQKARSVVNATRNSLRHKKVDFMRRVKIKLGCAQCGYKESPIALQFNHLDPSTKTFTIASTRGRDATMLEIKEEMRKCEVLCANCHAIHTYMQTQGERAEL